MPRYYAFIQTNNKQLFGAKVAKFALERHSGGPHSIAVEILNSDDIPVFKNFEGTEYRFKGNEMRTYRREDLQSFTLTRFMPPEHMRFEGRALVIDPDIFALADVRELLDRDMGGNAVRACRKKDAWDTSVMLLDCARLTHWKIEDMLERLSKKEADYDTLMTLKEEASVGELKRVWNHLDTLTPETKMLHTTGRLTQPWKTGLPIDFTRNRMPKIFGIIPREPVHKLLGKYPSTYQPHPDKNIEKFFFDLVRDALQAGAISKKEIESEIRSGNIRKDFLSLLNTS